MVEYNEAAQVAAKEAQGAANKKELEELMAEFPNLKIELSTYPDAELTGNKLYVNEQGAREGGYAEGREWLSFVYYEAKSADGIKEPWYGAIDPSNGEVISTGSELQHWFD